MTPEMKKYWIKKEIKENIIKNDKNKLSKFKI